MKNPIILALDFSSLKEAEELVEELKDYVKTYKVGKELFTSAGPEAIKVIKEKGCEVFLDLKYHDIPNTVGKACAKATELGVFMMNVHCSGGKEMLKAAAKAVDETSSKLNLKKPLVIGVTVLTSLDNDALNELKIKEDINDYIVYLAKLAKECGLDGVVCSPNEIKSIREACGEDFVIVTPGIRPAGVDSDDQKRTNTPKAAIEAGANYLVIGRAIKNAEDRVKAAKEILEEI